MTPRVSREDVNPEVVKLLTEAIILSKPVWSAIPSVDPIKRVYGLTLKSKF